MISWWQFINLWRKRPKTPLPMPTPQPAPKPTPAPTPQPEPTVPPVTYPNRTPGGSVATYPATVQTLSLNSVYDQMPGRSNAKGNRISGGLKTLPADAASLPGGAGTYSATGGTGSTPRLNVPAGNPVYSGWDFTGVEIAFSGTTTVSFTDCTIKATDPQLVLYFPSGSITISLNWCTIDGTGHNLSFGSFYMNGATSVDLTMTNCYYVAEPIVAFIRAGSTVGSDVITDNYFGTLNQGGASGDHCEYYHDISTAAGTRSITVQRNFFDGRNRTAGATNTITGYLRPENTGGTVNWLIEDNIFLGFGDPSCTNFDAADAFQFAGLGAITCNRNAIQHGSHGADGTYFLVSGNTLTGTNNRRWGLDGSMDTLIVEDGVS